MSDGSYFDENELNRWLEIAHAMPWEGTGMVIVELDHLAEMLWEYGEDELERRVRAGLTDSEMEAIGRLAWTLGTEQNLTWQKALSLASVSVLEGEMRALKRKRRRIRKA
jgi:hypothetical protein